MTRRLPRTVFDPPPEVDAGVLVFERRPYSLVSDRRWRGYRRFVAFGFRHGVRSVASARTLRKLRLTGRQPRELDPHEWAALFSISRDVEPRSRSGGNGHIRDKTRIGEET